MSDHELLREIRAAQQHQHELLHELLSGQLDILDAIASFESDDEKLLALKGKIKEKTEALKAALAAASAPPK